MNKSVRRQQVTITYMNEEMEPTESLTFVNVIKISEAKKNLILYFRDGSKLKVPNDKWFMYEPTYC